MADIKLIASDLDGTLFTTDKVITDRLKKAIKSITDKGILFVPATGRVHDAVPESIKNLYVSYMITSNGARIIDVKTGKDIVQNFIPDEYVDFVVEAIKSHHVIIEVFRDNKAFVDKKVHMNPEKYGVTPHHARYIKDTRIPVEDIFEDIKSHKAYLENINIIFDDKALQNAITKKLKDYGKLTVTSSSPINIEITSLLATKGNALGELSKKLGFTRDNVMAFGDSENDISMIEFAGIGVAMANADENVKHYAKIVADSCDDFGVAKIIEKLEKGEIK